MTKNRVSYNSQAVYIGPSPSSGYYFIDVLGRTNNNFASDYDNFNLIKRINRVTNFAYSINLPREDIKQMGKTSLVSSPILNSPNITVDLEYYLDGVTNEARMGWNVNHEFTEDFRSGELVYPNYTGIFIFSGLNTYDGNKQSENAPFWPGSNRSSKNIFLTLSKNPGEDEFSSKNKEENNVVAFGDGYMISYENSCSVGDLAKARASFICDNIIFYTGTSGLATPAVNPKNLETYPNVNFVIPKEQPDAIIDIVLPGDIVIDIEQNGSSDIEDFGVKLSDIKIQDYSISVRFDREDMTSIGYRAPANRRIIFPIKVNLGFNNIVGDESSARLNEIIKLDKKYNISLKMKNRNKKDIIIYDFKNASIQDYDTQTSIQQDRTLNFNFVVNLSPDNLTEGFFASGVLSNTFTTELMLTEASDFLTTETDDRIFLNLLPLY